ncbi:phage portal protein [Kurthia massiliensis]|uniref:phage portal protein n=1 Tax=Kurthia massiliensis TaxID=1033739 RepID=UPI000288B614|nr:phage portal protein [Kurthia massiliensis]
MAFFTRKNTKKLGSNDDEETVFSATIEVNNHVASVSESQAMMIPIFKNAVEVITNSIAQLPLQLMAKKPFNNVEIIENDTRLNILNKRANRYLTAYSMKKEIVKDLLLYGHAYLYRKGTDLHALEAKNMQVKFYTEDNVTIARSEYIFTNSKGSHLFDEKEIIHFTNGTKGILYDGAETLEMALNQQSYSKNIFKNGVMPMGLLKASTRLTEKAIQHLRTSFQNLYSGSNKAGKTIILEEGLDYQTLSLKPDELGLDKSNSRINSDIAKLFNIPLSMLEESANKYNSISAHNLLFLQTTISPLLKIIEETLNAAMLYEYEENQGFEFRFNTQELLRGTNEEQAQLATMLFEKGVISRNEVRANLELAFDDSKDFYKDSQGMIYRYEDGTILNLNMQIETTTNTETNTDSIETVKDSDSHKKDTNEIDSDLEPIEEGKVLA